MRLRHLMLSTLLPLLFDSRRCCLRHDADAMLLPLLPFAAVTLVLIIALPHMLFMMPVAGCWSQAPLAFSYYFHAMLAIRVCSRYHAIRSALY